MAESLQEPMFKTLNADDIDHTVTEVESCCMNCYKNVSFEQQQQNSFSF